MYCHNCGKQIPDDTKFCHYCGAAQTAPSQPEPRDTTGAPSPMETPSPKKKKSKGPVVAVVIAVILGFALLSRFVIVPAFLSSTEESTKNGSGAAMLADYTPPEFLGDDPLTFIFELDGARYQLPAPLSAFTENGWKLKPLYEEYPLPDMLDWGATEFCWLCKGNEKCHVKLINYADSPAPLETCAVFEISSDLTQSPETRMELPEGFTLGMDWDTMMGIIDPSDTMYYQTNTVNDLYDNLLYTEYHAYSDPDAVVRDEDGWVAQYNCDYVSIVYSYQDGMICGFTIHSETPENDRPRPDFDPAPPETGADGS